MQAGGRRFDPVRLHRVGVCREVVYPDRVCRVARGAYASVLVFGVSGVLFFGSVKRLVRPGACRGSGWSDPYPRDGEDLVFSVSRGA